MPLHPSRRHLVATIVLLASGGSLRAQSAAAPTAPAAPDETINLSPFTVESSRDYGYVSTNTLSGSRLSTKLFDTPVSISVLNSELMSDVGAFDMQDALKWSPNAYAATTMDVDPSGGGQIANGFSEASFKQTTVRIRGILEATIARDYFFSVVDSDPYNIERVDVSRGPDALLFGDASLGGVVNFSTKQALDRDFAHLETQFSSYGGRGRYTLDVNRVVRPDLAVRVNGLYERLDGWRDYDTVGRDGLSAAISWRPTKKGQLRLQGEWGRVRDVTPMVYLRDAAAGWNHTTTISTVGQAIPAGTGLASASNGMQFNLARPELGLTSLKGLAVTAPIAGVSFPIAPTLSPLVTNLRPAAIGAPATLDGTATGFVTPGFDFATSELAGRYNSRFSAVSAFFDQQIGEALFLEFAGDVQTRRIDDYLPQANQVFYDVNRVLPTGVLVNGSNANPDFLQPYVLQPMRDTVTKDRASEARASVIYGFKNGWADQKIGLLGNYRRTDDDNRVLRLVRTNGANPNLADVSNAVSLRSPFNDTGLNLFRYADVGRTYKTADGSTLAFGDYLQTNQATPDADESEVSSVQAFAAGSWLKSGRLHTTVGLRRDYSTIWRYNSPVADPVTSRTVSIGLTSVTKDTINSPSLGAVFDVLPSVGIYGNWSKTFALNPGTNPTYTGQLLPSRVGTGSDFGIKYELLGGRLSGSIGYYRTKEVNDVVSSPIGNIDAILTALNPNAQLFSGGASDTQVANSDGFEVEVLANLTPNWTLLINGGRPRSSLSDGAPFTRLYVDANRASWTAQAAKLGGTAPATVAANLVNEDNFLAGFRDGAPVASVRDYTANILSRYRFSQGWAKGGFVGGGANFFGKSYLGYDSAIARDVFGGDFYEMSAFVGYVRKLRQTEITLQINVNNLLGQTNFSSAGNFLTDGASSSFRTSNPREWRFSASAKF